jgi:hypothetical protein
MQPHEVSEASVMHRPFIDQQSSKDMLSARLLRQTKSHDHKFPFFLDKISLTSLIDGNDSGRNFPLDLTCGESELHLLRRGCHTYRLETGDRDHESTGRLLDPQQDSSHPLNTARAYIEQGEMEMLRVYPLALREEQCYPPHLFHIPCPRSYAPHFFGQDG